MPSPFRTSGWLHEFADTVIIEEPPEVDTGFTKAARIPYPIAHNQKLRFEGKVVLVTGAGRGIGRSLAIFYARRGAKVLVNDLGCSLGGVGSATKPANLVAAKIKSFGGLVVANHNSVLEPEKIVQQAIDEFGRIDILVCNAGIFNRYAFEDTFPEEWEKDMQVHLHSARKLSMLCWPHFKKQGFGRIAILTAGEGLRGLPNSASYCASKMALVGLSQSLALEGKGFNITCNAFALVAKTRMNRQRYASLPLMTQYSMHPKKVSPLVALLTHETCRETGSLFRAGGGQFYKLELQDCDSYVFDNVSPTPYTILQYWGESGLRTQLNYLGATGDLSLIGRVAIVTGANQGIGALIKKQLLKMGAKVVAHQESHPIVRKSKSLPAKRASLKRSLSRTFQMTLRKFISLPRITSGTMLQSTSTSPSGDQLIQLFGTSPEDTVDEAFSRFGRVDIIINCSTAHNAPDCLGLTSSHWDRMYKQHLESAYSITRAAWPKFKAQRFGRIINIATMGKSGDSHPGSRTFKMGLLGLSNALSAEGAELDIKVNTISGKYDPDSDENQIAVSLACLLSHPDAPCSGSLLEVDGDSFFRVAVQCSKGLDFNAKPIATWDYPEKLLSMWPELNEFQDIPVNVHKISALGLKTFQNLIPYAPTSLDINPFNFLKVSPWRIT